MTFLSHSQNLLVSGTTSLPRAAIGIFTSIMGSLLGSLGSTSSSGRSHLSLEEGDGLVCNSEEEAVLESSNLCNEGLLMFSDRNLEQQVKESREAFKQFDMVTGCLDHQFVEGAGKGLALPQVKQNLCLQIVELYLLKHIANCDTLPSFILHRSKEDG